MTDRNYGVKKTLRCMLQLFVIMSIFCGCSVATDNNDENYLVDLSLSSGILTPVFDRLTISYSVEVDYETSSISITPVLANIGGSVTVQGQTVSSGMSSQPINLAVGQNIISVVVATQGATTIQTYLIVVTRLERLSDNANLSSLFLSAGALSPVFDGNTIFYAADVARGTPSMTVTPTVAGVGATVKVNNVSVVSGSASHPIELDADSNINIVVTAQDTTTTKAYTLKTNFIDCSGNANGFVTFTYKGDEVTYGTVVSAEGRCWLDRNLGANPDVDPEEYSGHNDENGYGDLFQWGRGDDGHQNRDSNITFILSNTDMPGHGDYISAPDIPYDWRSPKNDDLWQGVDGINNPCPSGWRIPIESEWNVEISSWSQKGYPGAFDSPLKLTAAGYRGISDGVQIIPGALWSVGTYGMYWSDGKCGDGRSVRYLNFSDSVAVVSSIYRECALSVRCIKD